MLESNVSIANSKFSSNFASYGSGVLDGRGSNITVKDSTFNENEAEVTAVLRAYTGSIVYFYGSLTVNRNSASRKYLMHFTESSVFFMGSSTFSNNNGSLQAYSSNVTFVGAVQFLNNTAPTAMEGGAVTLFQSNLYCNGMLILMQNEAENGGGVHSLESSIYVNSEVTIQYNVGRGNGGGLYLANSELKCNTGSYLKLSSNEAKHNGGGIYATGSYIKTVVTYTYTGYTGAVIKFANNTAENGGGLSLEGSAKLYITKYKTAYGRRRPPAYFAVEFEGNTANYGGGIYMNDATNSGMCDSKQPAECFFQVLAIHNEGGDFMNTHSIHFIQNQATHLGSMLYGGLLDRCTISSFAEVQLLDDHAPYNENGLTYFNDSSIFTTPSIFSDPVKVCICIDDNNINCPQWYDGPINIRKGERFNLSVVAVDQAKNPVDATIQSSLKHTSSGLGEGQLIRTTSRFCTNLSFSVTSPHDNEELSLYALDGPCKDADLSTLTIEVQFLPCKCPIGFQPSGANETSCMCHCDEYILSFVTCDAQSESFVRQGQTNVWISYDNTTGYLVYPNCPYDYCKPLNLLISTPPVELMHSVLSTVQTCFVDLVERVSAFQSAVHDASPVLATGLLCSCSLS